MRSSTRRVMKSIYLICNRRGSERGTHARSASRTHEARRPIPPTLALALITTRTLRAIALPRSYSGHKQGRLVLRPCFGGADECENNSRGVECNTFHRPMTANPTTMAMHVPVPTTQLKNHRG